MAWIKIPKENHAPFRAALPKDARSTVKAMFGGLCAMANGHMYGGLFARSVFVRLDAVGAKEAMALDGTCVFDPMGRGAPMRELYLLPETIFDEPGELRAWLARALAYAVTLPPKKPKKVAAKPKTTAKPKSRSAKRV